jgi:paraquat-inducible protein B
MNSDSAYFRLGLFILVGIALIVSGVVVFGTSSTDILVVETVTMDSVEGLTVGAPVKFRGVQIGRVRNIELAYMRHKDFVRGMEQNLGNAVILELGIQANGLPANDPVDRLTRIHTAIKNGLRARIASSGLTGPPYVELFFVNPAESTPLQVPWITDKPYLPSAPSTVTEFLETAKSIINSIRRADLEKVINHADELLVDSRQAVNDLKVPELRQRAVTLIDEVRESNSQLQAILKNPDIQTALHNIADASGSFKQTIDNPQVRKFIADLPEISARVKNIADKVEKITSDEQIAKAIDGLAKTTNGAADSLAEVHRLVRNINLLLSSEQQNIHDALSDLRDMMDNASAVTGDARLNPSRLIFGQPPGKPPVGETK